MSEETPAPIAPILNITEQVMTNHLLTFLIQYFAAIQHITDKRQLVYEILHAWENKFIQSIDVVKKATAETYAETQEEDQDVWDIIVNASNPQIEENTKKFSENVRSMILTNLKLI